MTKEQEEVINRLRKITNRQILYGNKFGITIEGFRELQEDIETVLNMLKEKDAEIEKKDKMIDLMAEEMKKRATCPLDDYNYDLDCENKCNNNTKECWKQYFERKVEDECKR
ncbi:MAG: hypothetical protein ACLUWN_02370 [Clostridia bacterium]